MGQIRLIHEHYDSKPLRSLIVGLLIAILAGVNLITDKDRSLADLVLSALIVFPPFVIMVFELLRWNKPAIVVYNDRLEVRMPFKRDRKEILYSEIKNFALEAGQLRIWFDEYSMPSCYNLGENVKNAEDTYNILRATYDKYNQEYGIKPVPVESMPKKKAGVAQVVLIVTMICTLALLIIVRHFSH